MKKMERAVIFDKSLSREVLSIFDKTTDDEDFIVEAANPSQKVLTSEGEEILLEEFAGVTKGSELFIKSDITSLIELSKRKR